MKRILSSILCFLIMFNFCMVCLSQTVLAADATTEQETTAPEPNKWYGDTMAVPITSHNNGYIFRSVYVSPHHAYEMSNHMVSNNGGAGNDIPQTLILVDADSDYTWTPNGPFSPSSSNYRVLYCCDAETGYTNSVYYKRLNLEDSSYYDQEAAEHIRSIVTYSYPFVDLDVMKTRLEADGFAEAQKLTRAEIISAVQSAIWAYANTETGRYAYSRTFDVPTNSQWGGVVHDYTNEMDVWWTVGKRKFSSNDEVAARVNSLIDFLIGLEGTTAGRDGIIITGLNIIECVPVVERDGVFTVALMLNLNTSGNTGDSVNIEISVDDQTVTGFAIVPGVDLYNFTIQAEAGQTIKAVVSGTQYIADGVYFYEAEGGRDVSQSLVDVAAGKTAVYCEAKVDLPDLPRMPKADLTLYKTDDTGAALDGAAFTLCAVGQTEYVYVDTYSVDENGMLTLTDLIPGTYAILETTTPAGFHPLNSEILFNVTDEGAVEAIILPAGVTAADEEGTFTISVVNIPESTSVSGEKIWDDEDNADGLRPESVTIHLLANNEIVQTKTVTAADEWKWSFTDLPTMVDSTPIVYTVSEDAVPAYETIIDGYNVINKYVPETVEVAGQKTWNDDGNRDGLRPESITICLLADGTVIDTATASAANGWAWSFTNLPVYRDGGAKIEYTITEEAVDGYTAEINGFNAINTHVPEKTSVPVEKVWKDADNRDGTRPDQVTVKLLANGADTGKTVVLREDNGWKATFDDLYVYQNGTPIAYTVEEIVPAGYTAFIEASGASGYTITNVRDPEQIDIPVVKHWNDDNNRDGLRPDHVLVRLFADGVDTGIVTTISAANGWRATISGLDAYKNGAKINYTVEEVEPAGYLASVTGDSASGFVITNSRKSEKVDISGHKFWNDNNNALGKRPESITVNLLANDVIVESKIVTAADGWAWTFADLAVYQNGSRIVYRITENAVPGYETTYQGFNIINTSIGEKVYLDIPVGKIWDDFDNASGARPESITVELMVNGVNSGKTLILSDDNHWGASFTDLPAADEDGNAIHYTVRELSVESYDSTVTGDAAVGFIITNTYTEEFEDDPVPLSPPTGDRTFKLIMVLAVAAAAFVVTVNLKKKGQR